MVGTIGIDDIILPRQAAAAMTNADQDADKGMDAAENTEVAEAADVAAPKATVVSKQTRMMSRSRTGSGWLICRRR